VVGDFGDAFKIAEMLEHFLRKKAKAKDDLFELDDPNALLKKEAYDDCLSCRVLGKNQTRPWNIRF